MKMGRNNMPCSDNRPGDREYDRQLQLFWKAFGQSMCEWYTSLENGNPSTNLRLPLRMDAIPKDHMDWWEAHKEWDAMREKSYE